MMRAEYRKGCPQRDGVENEGYAGARSVGTLESKERDGAKNLLERILDRDNLNRAYKQIKRNHGAPGIDGMSRSCRKTETNSCRASGKVAISGTRYDARKSPNQMEAE
ncbi:hypothetical protein [Paenibacillus peoriae]|uniref:hypothetical protein n=1 Tax=Paenibacillus peoriae TaxID=59893 RepID=UPI00215A9BCF|nr:hypothetical protein [Paenibacillus peoriae]